MCPKHFSGRCEAGAAGLDRITALPQGIQMPLKQRHPRRRVIADSQGGGLLSDAPTRGRRGEATRQRLLGALLELLNNRPITQISVVDIAKLAGVTHTAFYIYFANVAEALLCASNELSQSPPDLVAIFEDGWAVETAWEKAAAFVRRYRLTWDENRPLLRARNLAAEEGDMAFGWSHERSLAPLLGAIARHVSQGQAVGRIDPTLDADAMAGALMAMLERVGQVGHISRNPSPDWDRDYPDAITYMVVRTLGWGDATMPPADRLA